MAETVRLSTQGISDDWMSANGDFDTKYRGVLKRIDVLSALLHLSPLKLPDGAECPPHVLIESEGDPITFIGQGGAIECLNASVDVTAEQGVALAFGEITIASLEQAVAPPPPAMAPPPPAMSPPPPKPQASASKKPRAGAAQKPRARKPVRPAKPVTGTAPRPQSKGMKAAGILGAVLGAAMGGGLVGGVDSAAAAATGIGTGVAMSNGKSAPSDVRQKNTWRQYVLYVIATPFLLFMLISFIGIFAASNSDGRMGAVLGLLISGFIGLGIIYLARKKRPWVDENGSIYTGVMIAEMLAADDLSDDFSDDGGVDFD